ncbi:hypothetical protein K432DRAFT_393410 [Lepidopterella palustris CBS 459.81]|uniref:Uncharacterized protein n=1 Tax=Lepidopterella palustris CBS 459.81 TaxID=1314670 RepID=A0A8E2E9Q5_9PEZI|nr:hypothetical protein K432DRAFT_393410 [Lepidopterella palustris CBS 459.81]
MQSRDMLTAQDNNGASPRTITASSQLRSLSSSSQISWRSILSILIPLALAVVMQPSGKVCGYPRHLQMYLRSSPVICVADVLSVLFRILVCILDGMPTSEAVQFTLATRFADTKRKGQPSLIPQGPSLYTFLRWLLFIAGAVPQAHLLLFTSGVLWAEVWGYMYLLCFGVFEPLPLIWKPSLANSGQQAPWEFEPGPEAERSIGDIGLLIHFSILGWALDDIWNPHLLPAVHGPQSRMILVFATGVLFVILIYFPARVINKFFDFSESSPGEYNWFKHVLYLALHLFSFGSSCLGWDPGMANHVNACGPTILPSPTQVEVNRDPRSSSAPLFRVCACTTTGPRIHLDIHLLPRLDRAAHEIPTASAWEGDKKFYQTSTLCY